MLELAQSLGVLGYDVFPIRGKLPLIRWKDGARKDWDYWPEEADGIGIATGARSGIVVIDDDRGKHRLDPWSPEVPTGVVFTKSGGRHWYYRHPGGVVPNSAGKVADFVDVRGDGGYVVSYGIPAHPLELLPEGFSVPKRKAVPPPYLPPMERPVVLEAVMNGRIFGREGNRNNVLFQIALAFYANDMPINVLYQGALDAGLQPDEIERTLSSAQTRVR